MQSVTWLPLNGGRLFIQLFILIWRWRASRWTKDVGFIVSSSSALAATALPFSRGCSTWFHRVLLAFNSVVDADWSTLAWLQSQYTWTNGYQFRHGIFDDWARKRWSSISLYLWLVDWLMDGSIDWLNFVAIFLSFLLFDILDRFDIDDLFLLSRSWADCSGLWDPEIRNCAYRPELVSECCWTQPIASLQRFIELICIWCHPVFLQVSNLRLSYASLLKILEDSWRFLREKNVCDVVSDNWALDCLNECWRDS